MMGSFCYLVQIFKARLRLYIVWKAYNKQIIGLAAFLSNAGLD